MNPMVRQVAPEVLTFLTALGIQPEVIAGIVDSGMAPIGITPRGKPVWPIKGGDGTAPAEPMSLTVDQVKELVSNAVAEGIKAVNTVDPADRPGAGAGTKDGGAPAVLRRRYPLPRLGTAVKATYDGQWRQSQAFERDFTQAAREVFGYDTSSADDDDPVIEQAGAARNWRGMVWPKSRGEFMEVLYAMGESQKSAEMADTAIKAMGEATVGAGGALVPTVYAQDMFAYALLSPVALRQIPGIQTLSVAGSTVILPRESVAAGASSAAEAGALSAQDPTFAQQTLTIKKQYGYRLYSNELANDANPSVGEFLANSLVRDVGLRQDIQWLEGDGTGNNVTGFVAYSGSTAGPSLGANGASPTFDHAFDFVYNLRLANVEPDAFVAHPRYVNSLSKLKDTSNNYLMSNAGGYNVPQLMSTGLPNASAPKFVLLGTYPGWFSSQINILRTVGSSTDTSNVYLFNRNNIVIIEAAGIEVAFSEHVAFANDQTAARAIGRSAIAVLQPAALGVMTGVRP